MATFTGVEGTGIEPNFSDFYETTFMETSGRNEVDLCVVALMLLRLAKTKNALEPDVCAAITKCLSEV